jgi:hypothetical protein
MKFVLLYCDYGFNSAFCLTAIITATNVVIIVKFAKSHKLQKLLTHVHFGFKFCTLMPDGARGGAVG